MSDKLKELYEKVSGDDNLKESLIKGLEAISNDDEKKSFIIDFAKDRGITLTMEDFPKTDGMKPLHEDDLENVAGGGFDDAITSVCGDTYFIVCAAFFASAGLSDAVSDC